MRKIPATMASQHPDHASKPYWYHDEFISVQQETEECFRAFSELGIDEYKWDWEGKFVDESVLERLLSQHYEYFQNSPLGKEKFLTFRLPNPKVETEYRLGRAFMGIISAAGLAKQVSMNTPPLFEVILPMTESAGEMISIQEAFREMTSLRHPLLKLAEEGIKHIEMIPLFEDIDTIMNSDKILETYLVEHQGIFGTKPTYIRPYVARSDPALNAGIVPTVLSIKIAFAKYAQFSKEKNIPLFPVIGAAALPFRGGMTPDNIDQFINEYEGVQTTLIQSAFRYDYPKDQVISAIQRLSDQLPKRKPQQISAEEEESLREIMKIFTSEYQKTIEGIAPLVNKVAGFLPKRRERVQHVGLFGYSRGIGKVKLPRAIGFTAALYSLGIPPEMIGTGRGLRLISNNQFSNSNKNALDLVEKFYVNIRKDLLRAGRYVNKEVLNTLAKQSESWQLIAEDIQAIETYLGEELKPITQEEKAHQNIVSEIFTQLKAGENPQKHIIQAALLRKSLG